MTAAGLTTLLAASKVLFSGRQFAVARHQLRLVVGFLKALAKVWPQDCKNIEEIQIIAQEVLRINKLQPRLSQNQPVPENGVVAALGSPAVEKGPCVDAPESWDNPTVGLDFSAQNSSEPFWNVNYDLQADVPLCFNSYWNLDSQGSLTISGSSLPCN
ncbi:hypothetical protein F5Y18DRAFT_424338 [Xylariaceae sp. FL1019]|nr:hypothetical protein F5Y18DRAFT_424338 [Xylariaceae sp. FL1019]